ncbi:hypothetical protein [Phycicoccus sp.]|uniref:hypothetical protein n=1 Tax=Phycicoccus sp. TaxID=1902410 RepID=UPI002C2E8801|nr:hypothetical protein [Phycicoccus sp.]HMM95350.1 hypothetical protein [Phycicoccus sp.]
MTATEVADGVRRRYGCLNGHAQLPPEWAALEEFSLYPGGGRSRADLFLVKAWRSGGHLRHGVEIKVSRSDLKHELDDLRKSEPIRSVCHEFWLATPKGLVHADDPIPADWGIYEVTPTATTVRRRAARNQTPEELPYSATVEAFRRAARAEARIRTAEDGDTAAQLVVALRERDAAVSSRIRAQNELTTARQRAVRASTVLARYAPSLRCSMCQTPVHFRRGILTHVERQPRCSYPYIDENSLPEDTPDG